MAEIILAIVCIVIGVLCILLAVLTLFANAFGGATNRAAVNLWPVLVLAGMAVVGVGGGVAILVL